MPTVDSNFFEIQRRGSQWSKNSTLDDQVTPMGWDADPNGAISGRTAGETKLVAMLIGANFVISNGDIWWKTAMPNTWTKQGSGTGGSGDTSYLLALVCVQQTILQVANVLAVSVLNGK